MNEFDHEDKLPSFDLEAFLPFILNQVAEATGKAFQDTYRSSYNMSRTQWRVLAIIGRYGSLTARDICAIAHEEKSRVSRAVSALEDLGILRRETSEEDRRVELLSLTQTGRERFEALGKSAISFDRNLRAALGPKGEKELLTLLERLTDAIEQTEIT